MGDQKSLKKKRMNNKSVGELGRPMAKWMDEIEQDVANFLIHDCRSQEGIESWIKTRPNIGCNVNDHDQIGYLVITLKEEYFSVFSFLYLDTNLYFDTNKRQAKCTAFDLIIIIL